MRLFARGHRDFPSDTARLGQALDAALTVSEVAASATPLPQALNAMLRTAVELLGAEQGSIMLLDNIGRRLVVSASLDSNAPVGHRMGVAEGIAGRVLASGRPLLLGGPHGEAPRDFVDQQRPLASSAVVPLRGQGRVIGVLSLAIADGDGYFTDEDLRVAQMFADQAAGAIYRARLHESAEQRSSDLMALVEASRGLLGTLDLEELLQKVFDGAARLAGASAGFACLFDAETERIARGVFRGVEKRQIATLVTRPELRRAVAECDVVSLDADEIGPVVVVGLQTGQGSSGAVVMGAEPSVVPERGDLLRAFAQQCTSAIGAAEIYAALRRKESEMTSIIDGVPNPIVLVDARSRMVALNPAAEHLFHVSSMFSAGAPVEGALAHPEIEALLAGGGDVQTEVTAGAPPKTYKARVTSVRMPGMPVGRVMIMDDVTTEREASQLQRDFVAMIGHELRTPLTIIKGFARTLIRRGARTTEEQMLEMVGTIDSKAAQLERLIEDLLYVSKIESRESALRIEEVDLVWLIESVAEEVLRDYPERRIRLNAPSELRWHCDGPKIGLVLRHLVENSLKYSEDEVTIRAAEEGDDVRIDVIDRGVGIVSSELPHIFDRFRQLDSSSTREHGGTGVGLYLCSQLVRVHSGRIWADSTWGKGSSFSFTLPRRSTGRKILTFNSLSEEQTA